MSTASTLQLTPEQQQIYQQVQQRLAESGEKER